MNTRNQREEMLTLELLDAINQNSHVSQRHLAQQMGVALGLANSYLKRCLRKGLIKIREAPANRYLYYLTPKGFTEKSYLTAKYLAVSLSFYRKASNSCLKLFEICSERHWRRIVLCGVSDLAEIVSLQALHTDIKITGIFDPFSEQTHYFDRPIWHESAAIEHADGFILTDLTGPLRWLDDVSILVDRDKLLIPDILDLA